jgi:protoheme IX farnesyltransferase
VTLFGIGCVIASGCVFNNYIDRDIDGLMERTKKRALVQHVISNTRALIFGVILMLIGFGVLVSFTNKVTVLVAVLGFFVYVGVYSLWLKRISVHSALVGSISGAVPIAVGYLAVTGSIDNAVLILFFSMVLWQMPHSYAIALYRLSDYKNASIPVMPLTYGVLSTKIQMVMYALLYTSVVSLLYFYSYVGILYFYVMLAAGLFWVIQCIYGLSISNEQDQKKWAKKVFLFSIILLLIFCIMISI